jgi:hypothetical protein
VSHIHEGQGGLEYDCNMSCVVTIYIKSVDIEVYLLCIAFALYSYCLLDFTLSDCHRCPPQSR